MPWNASLTEVTSDIEQLCFCDNGRPACDLELWPISTYPGGHIDIPAVAVGQLNGTNPGIVLSRITNSKTARISEQEERQQVGVQCQNLTYTIHSLENVQFKMTLDIAFGGREFQSNQVIQVNTEECPKGFQLGKSLTCSCIPLLEDHRVSCSLETQDFERLAMVWIGYSSETNTFFAHHNCPLQKCKPERSTFTLNSTDSQCEGRFSGILCGGCTTNFSATFGKIACKKCTNAHSALVVAIFVVAGPLLVAAMLYGDLTVDKGTFNGAIFYANMVHIYRSVLFGQNHINVVTLPIAWLNLDLGLEVCFYSGMTFYMRLWFQYLFPAYIISLALILSCLNWYTTLGGKIIGNKIKNVTGTLILISYTKLLRTLVETLSFTTISSSQGSFVKVWLYDGNTPYMQAKHIVLSVFAIATLICFLLPYTVLMVFEYPLLRHKTRKIVLKLGLYSLINSYQKPYKKHLRWWTGMMLLARVLLVILYQVSIIGNQRLNLIIFVTFGLCILGIMWNVGSLYHNKYVTMIETFYLTNLVLLTGWSDYVSTPRSQLILSHVLVTLALLVLIATILYHVINKIIEAV